MMTFSPNTTSVSILLCGDVNGKFKSLFKTVTKLNKEKGPFEALYCVGNFFGESDSNYDGLKKDIKCPIACYVLGPTKQEYSKYFLNLDGGEIAPNVIYLGKRGILTTASGLKVAYLSGLESSSREVHTFCAKDITDLQNSMQSISSKGVDLLLTCQWPKHVTRNLPISKKIDLHVGESELISYLAVTLKPCYHFSGVEDVFFERVPYRNSKIFSDKTMHTTRFVGLASVGNPNKMQFLYGINHIPLQKARQDSIHSTKLNEIATECPYPLLSEIPSTIHSVKNKHRNNEENRENKKNNFKQMQCWFCLGLKIEENLIVSVWCDCYIALAKGGIVEDHLLIIPNSHQKCVAHLSDDAITEIGHIQEFLRKFYCKKGKQVVFFERNFKSPHMQLQAIAIPEEVADFVVSVVLETAASMTIDLVEIPPYTVLKQIANHKQYFHFEIEMKGHLRRFIHLIEDDFPLDFARIVLANDRLLNVPDRIDWKKCSLPPDEEMLLCKKLRSELQNCMLSSC